MSFVTDELIEKHKDRLKNCPFCNSSDLQIDQYPMTVVCNNCHSSVSADLPGHLFNDKFKHVMHVIDKWNTRGGVRDETLFVRDYPTYEI